MNIHGYKETMLFFEIWRALLNDVIERYEEHQAQEAMIQAKLENLVSNLTMSEETKFCYECKETILFQDHSDGLVCTKCGLVVNKNNLYTTRDI